MMSPEYKLLEQESSEDLQVYEVRYKEKVAALARVWKVVYILLALLSITVVSSVILHVQLQNTQALLYDQSYTGLQRNITTPIPHDDRTIDDPMWDSPEFDFFTGWVALDDEFVEEKGLPTSMRWPWDDSKSIYIFHAYHSLHCVFVLRNAIMNYHDNKNQTWGFEHVTHCLHVLREDATCNADDTPRYAGSLHAQVGHTVTSSGTGQIRMCRDWSKLRQFALEHSACYRRPLDYAIPLLDRYKFCPDGSTPWETHE